MKFANFCRDCLEKVQSAIAEINKVKKLCKTEMLQNENLCMFKTRIETDINMCEHQLEQEVRKRTYLEREMHQIATIINQIDDDAQKLNVVRKCKMYFANYFDS